MGIMQINGLFFFDVDAVLQSDWDHDFRNAA